jgi:hypothetical protein
VKLAAPVQYIFRALFPASRKPVTWPAAYPLIGFLVVFVGAVFFLEWRDILRFTRPSAFWLALIIPWFWWLHCAGFSGLHGKRAIVALLTRLALVGAFIMLLAEPRAVRKSDALSLVYALDVSDSMGER